MPARCVNGLVSDATSMDVVADECRVFQAPMMAMSMLGFVLLLIVLHSMRII